MKKLYNKKGKIHPTPPSTTTNHHHLNLLPAALVALAATLSQEDQEVLAYLVSCSGANPHNTKPASARTSGCGDHPPKFNCNCFGCYMSYWVRWDSSPNRQQIHEIIDAYEDGLLMNDKKSGKNKKERRKKVSPAAELVEKRRTAVEDPVGISGVSEYGGGDYGSDDRRRSDGDGEVGSVRKIMNFLGERVWGTVWGI